MTNLKLPFDIYVIDEAGLNIVVSAGRDPITSEGRALLPGESITITEAIYDANKDALGNTWLDYDDDEQLRRWGRLRFGVGEVSDAVKQRLARDRRDALEQERQFLIQRNPRLARQSAGALRLGELDAELGRA